MDRTASRPNSFRAIRDSSITSAARGHRTGKSILKKDGRNLRSEAGQTCINRKENVVRRNCIITLVIGIILLSVIVTPALSHHSFAMYDQSKTKTMTGKLTRYIPGANHVQMLFSVVDNDGKEVMQDGKPLQ